MKPITLAALALVLAFALQSCNTMIGMGRDIKYGYHWTQEKVQGSGSNGSSDPYGAPVY